MEHERSARGRSACWSVLACVACLACSGSSERSAAADAARENDGAVALAPDVPWDVPQDGAPTSSTVDSPIATPLDSGPEDAIAPRETSPGLPGKFVGNITTREKVDPSGLVFSTYWDHLTPENAGIWGNIQKMPGGAFNWSAMDALYAYTVDKGIAFFENAFVWGAWQPGQPGGTIGEEDVKTWMRAFCERYPKTQAIEVVKEPPPHSKPYYADAIGGGTDGDWAWITNAFRWARQACPKATLVLSDYGVLDKADETQHLVDIVKTIQAAGAPIDAIGASLYNGEKVAAGTVASALAKLHGETNLPVYIAGYRADAKDDERQRQIYQSHFQIFLQTPYVTGIRIEGWIYDEGTSPPWIGLVRNGTSRPAMTWLMNQLGRPAP